MPTLPWRFLILTEGGADSASPSALGRLHTLEPVPPAGVPVAPPGAGAIGATAPGAGAATGSAAAGTEAGTPAADRWLAALGARFELPLTGNRTAAVTVDRLAALSPKTLRASLPDGAAGTELDAVLHHPAVQRLESAARGIDLLCRAAPAGFEIEVLAATRAELVARFRELVFDPRATGPADALPSLILADYDFSHRAGDLAILRELAGLARILQAPVVAGASPGFFDFRHAAHVFALPDPGARLADPAHAGWREFQASDDARWTALTINRFLQREPFVEEATGHAEATDEGRPETFLWGRGIWLVGAAVARSVARHGHALDLAGPGGLFEGLPARAYPVAANEKVPLSTEAPLPEQAALELSRAAFTPVVGKLRSHVALLPMTATAHRMRPGKLTVEGTLAYQLLAGRLAQFCTLLLDRLPGEGPQETARFLGRELAGFLGPLAGGAEDAVTVEPGRTETDGTVSTYADVLVRPAAQLEGKMLEFRFRLPLPA